MARLWTTGIELGHLVAAGLIPSGATLPLAVTDRARTGTYSMKVVAGATDSWAYRTIPGAAVGRSYFLRDEVYLDALPSTGYALVFGYQTTAGAQWSEVRIYPDGSVRVFDNSFPATPVAQTAAGAITAGAFTRMTYRCKINAAADDEFELKINGVTVFNVTSPWLSAAFTEVFFGQNTSTAAGGCNVWHDDMCLNDDQGADQNSFPGEGAVRKLMPTAQTLRDAGWLKPGGATTNLNTAVDNIPSTGVAHSTSAANAERQIYNITSNATDSFRATLQSYDAAGVPSTDTIKLVQPVAVVGASTTTGAPTGSLECVSNPVIAEVNFGTFRATTPAANAGTFPTGWNMRAGSVAYAPTVVRATGPVVEIGQRVASTTAKLVSQLALLVESEPSAGGSFSGAAADSAPATDTAAGLKTTARAASDSAPGTDTSAGRKTTARAAADTAGGADAAGAFVRHFVSAADTAPATDVASAVKSKTGAAADVAGASDAAAASRSIARSFADSAPGADAVTGRKTTSRAAADTAPGTDTAAGLHHGKRAAADSAGGADSALGATGTVATASDSAPATDTAAVTARSVSRTAADNAGGTDTAAGTKAGTRAATDTAPATDTATGRRSVSRGVGDIAPATDTGAGRKTTARGAADGAGAADSASGVRAGARGAADSAPGADVASGRHHGQRAAADVAGGADVLSRVVSVKRAAADTAPASDGAVGSGAHFFNGAAADSAPAVDAVSGRHHGQRAAGDVAPGADGAAGRRAVSRGVSDVAGGSDAASAVMAAFRAAVDAAGGSDVASGAAVRHYVVFAVDVAGAADAGEAIKGAKLVAVAVDSATAADVARGHVAIPPPVVEGALSAELVAVVAVAADGSLTAELVALDAAPVVEGLSAEMV